MLDPYPKVILVPGIGMIATGKDVKSASIVSEIYEDFCKAKGVILENHGLITWGPDSKTSYSLTIEMVTRNKEAHDLTGPFNNGVDSGIAHHPFHAESFFTAGF